MNVLLLSDFSPVAINATHYAMDLLQDQEAHFHLLNIFDKEVEEFVQENKLDEKKNATLATLYERVEKLRERSRNRNHKVSGHYSEQRLVDAARNYVTKHNIDFIVMGSVGEKFEHLTILGNHTFEIITKVRCNLLAVPEEVHYVLTEKLLMPLDYPNIIKSSNLKFLKNNPLFKKQKLDVWEILHSKDQEQKCNFLWKDIIRELKNLRINFSAVENNTIYDKRVWEEVQNQYDLVILMGKNVVICERLLHNQHGLNNTTPNRLPILVLHD